MSNTPPLTISQTLTLALQHHQRGDLRAAETLYREILNRDARHADALHLLGVIAYQSGQHTQAESLIRRALKGGPPVAMYYNSLGLVQRALGRAAEAAKSFRMALRHDASLAEALANLAHALSEDGKPEEAESVSRRGLELHSDAPAVHYALAVALWKQGKIDGARTSFQRALALNPDDAEVHNSLGLLDQESGQHAQALIHLQRATTLRPGYAEAHNNLGNSLSRLGRLTEAVRCYQQALAIRPELAEAHENLGNTYHEMSRPEDAVSAYQAAFRIGRRPGARIKALTTMPVIPGSVAEIHEYRQRLERGLDELLAADLHFSDPLKDIGRANFFFAYQGLNNRVLHSRLAQLYLKACPSLAWVAPPDTRHARRSNRLRIGFISSFMHDHSIGKTTRGLVAALPRERFEIYALFVPPVITDDVSALIRAKADRSVAIAPTLDRARRQIAELDLDILFYQDIGMEPFTYFLSFSRLAPVQCVSFGHPDTTGVPNMDYWVSSDLYELPDADEHYSEKLVRLHNLPTLAYYARPELPNPLKPRADFGLPSDAHVYICPQTLFKFHPEFDPLLAGILRADPVGLVVLVEGKNPYWAERLHARFQNQIPDVANRIRFVPPQSGGDFINLIAISDVMLDTTHFNGMNTSLEAFAAGTPVVTLPTDFQRGRHTSGMYSRMGISECTAGTEEEYVRIALRLGTDSAFNRRMRELIRERSNVLFENPDVLQEFERFFTEAVVIAGRDGGRK